MAKASETLQQPDFHALASGHFTGSAPSDDERNGSACQREALSWRRSLYRKVGVRDYVEGIVKHTVFFGNV